MIHESQVKRVASQFHHINWKSHGVCGLWPFILHSYAQGHRCFSFLSRRPTSRESHNSMPERQKARYTCCHPPINEEEPSQSTLLNLRVKSQTQDSRETPLVNKLLDRLERLSKGMLRIMCRDQIEVLSMSNMNIQMKGYERTLP